VRPERRRLLHTCWLQCVGRQLQRGLL